ncbi:MAG: response regulator [Spirochaetota bacterium]
MKKILIIDDNAPVREILKSALKDKGYTVYEAKNGEEGLAIFKNIKPEIVLTDVRMPELSGIEITKHIKEIKEDADVIIMTGFGSEELVIEALQAGASNYIKKPIVFSDLFTILDNIINKREYRKRYEIARDVVVSEQKEIIIGNDVTNLWGVINQILFNISPRVESRLHEGMRLGLYEILVNAIEHGNLGISYEEKTKAQQDNSYLELLKAKIIEADAQGKRVYINSTYKDDTLKIEIRDEGEGFDFNALPDMSDPENVMASHGRGIFLCSIYFDQIVYAKPGNCVTLIKRFSSPPEPHH